MSLHPIFAQIIDAHMGVTKAVTREPDLYRGWLISFDYPPIPYRGWDWSATHPDYDGAPDAGDNRAVSGATREQVIREIDLWHEENDA